MVLSRGGAVYTACRLLRAMPMLSTAAAGVIVPGAGVIVPRPVTLITFDVDGTLVQGSGSSDASAHSRAFAAALGSVLGSGTPTALPAELLPREKVSHRSLQPLQHRLSTYHLANIHLTTPLAQHEG